MLHVVNYALKIGVSLIFMDYCVLFTGLLCTCLDWLWCMQVHRHMFTRKFLGWQRCYPQLGQN